MGVAIVTVSDRCSRGEAEDLTGPALRDALAVVGAAVLSVTVVPDDHERIRAELIRLSDQVGADVVFTRGAAGLRGTTLIVNLPGSPRGAMECLEIV